MPKETATPVTAFEARHRLLWRVWAISVRQNHVKAAHHRFGQGLAAVEEREQHQPIRRKERRTEL